MRQIGAILANYCRMAMNILWVYIVFMVCRLVFVAANYHFYEDVNWAERWKPMLSGALHFDTTAILYANSLFILLSIFPFHWKETEGFQKFLRWLYVVVNFLCVAINFCDTAYFPFTNRRTTCSVFQEFSNNDNLIGIFGAELVHSWYLVLIAIFLGWALYKLYIPTRVKVLCSPAYYYLTCLLLTAFTVPLFVGLVRGGFKRDIRPITISNANQYVDRPIETGIVLNTPFCLMRTMGKKVFKNPEYFKPSQREEMLSLYSPMHIPSDTTTLRKKNVVVIVIESFGKEYIGSLNKDLEGGTYKGYTPFMDSLITKSLRYKYSFANGRKSIDGLPSTLSGIPRVFEPFFLTPASLNNLTSIGGELKKEGYYTAFFHGATHGSMGFEAYTRSVGYTDYFGREDFNNDEEFDGHWGIWDEPFLQYFAEKMNTFQQPFATGLFTLSSHHPFRVPKKYEGHFPKGHLPIHQCIGYTDKALREFFNTASKMPWFENTLFVITADHTNQPEHEKYFKDIGLYEIPIIFYTPDGELQGEKEGISQQIDIMPTVLGYLGYKRPYISFGCDLLTTPLDETFAVNDNGGTFNYFKGDYMIQFNGQKVIGVYKFKVDPLMKDNLLGKFDGEEKMKLELESFIQQYMERMIANDMIVK